MGQDYQHSLFHKNQKVVVDNYPHKDFQEHSAGIARVLVPGDSNFVVEKAQLHQSWNDQHHREV